MTPTNPVVGWRVWRLKHGRLVSLAKECVWQPGENMANCLSPEHGCDRSPGRGCGCGFWALWDPARCVTMARSERDPAIGLVAGWGNVAIHGTEGFRAEHVTVLCLLRDWAWSEVLDAVAGLGTPRRCQRIFQRWGRTSPLWTSNLHRAAATYAVPLVTLRDAIQIGMLRELGVNRDVIRGIAASLGQAA